jgi:hypothetical protein
MQENAMDAKRTGSPEFKGQGPSGVAAGISLRRAARPHPEVPRDQPRSAALSARRGESPGRRSSDVPAGAAGESGTPLEWDDVESRLTAVSRLASLTVIDEPDKSAEDVQKQGRGRQLLKRLGVGGPSRSAPSAARRQVEALLALSPSEGDAMLCNLALEEVDAIVRTLNPQPQEELALRKRAQNAQQGKGLLEKLEGEDGPGGIRLALVNMDLSFGHLEALYTTLALMKRGPREDMILQQVQAVLEQKSPGLSPPLQEKLRMAIALAVKADPSEPPDVPGVLAEAERVAPGQAHVAVVQAAGHLLAKGVLQPDVTAFFVAHSRTADGHAYVFHNDALLRVSRVNASGSAGARKVVEIANHCLGLRVAESQQAYDASLLALALEEWPRDEGKLLGHKSFADRVVAAVNHLDDLQRCRGAQIPPSPALVRAIQALVDARQWKLEQGTSVVKPLGNLVAGLKSLGLDELARSVAASIERRKSDEATAHWDLSKNVCEALLCAARSGQLKTGVAELMQAIQRRTESLVYTGLDFEGELATQVGRLDAEQRKFLGEALSTQEFLLIYTALRELRQTAVCQTMDELRLDLHALESVLMAVRCAADPACDPAVETRRVISRFSLVHPGVLDALSAIGGRIDRVLLSARANTPYLLPVSALEVAADDVHPTMIDDLCAMVRVTDSKENFVFLQAMKRQPTLVRANDIVRRFIAQDVPEQVNVPGELRLRIEQASAQANRTRDKEDVAAVWRLLNEARDEVIRLMNTNPTQFANFAQDMVGRASQPIVTRPVPEKRRVLRIHLTALAAAGASTADIEKEVGFLRVSITRDDPKPPEYWNDFDQSTLALLASFNGKQLASLLYNLDRIVDPEVRNEDHVFYVRLAASQLLQDKREGRMTLESVMLTLPQFANTMGMEKLKAWLDLRVVNEEQVAAAFRSLDDARLAEIASSPAYDRRLVGIAGNELRHRATARPRTGGSDIKT